MEKIGAHLPNTTPEVMQINTRFGFISDVGSTSKQNDNIQLSPLHKVVYSQ